MSNYTNFNTRIQSKIDTLSGWEAVKDTFIPLNGEICIAVIETADSVEGKILPPVMIKVGNGQINANGNIEGSTWDELDWVSAKAADVYGWAKQSTNDFVNTFLSLTMSDGTTMQSKLDGVFATDAELAQAIADLRTEIPTQLGVMSIKVTDDNVVIGTPEEATTGNVTIDLKHKQYEKAGSTTDVSSDATAAGASVTIKVPTLKIDKYGHTEFDGETSHTITIPSEVAVGDGNITIEAGNVLTNGLTNGTFNVNQDTDQTIKLDLDIKFNSDLVEKDNKKYLQILDKTDNTVIAEFDTTEFIKDGMIKSVELQDSGDGYPEKDGPYLVFTWNIDNAISEDEGTAEDVLWVSVKDLVDVYTAGNGIEVENFVISHKKPTTVASDVTKKDRTYVTAITFDEFGHATGVETATETDPDYTDEFSAKADKVSGATSGNFAGLDANGNLTDSGMNAANFEGAGTAQGLIDALDSQIKSSDEDNNKVSVLTGITQENGKLTTKTEVKLAAVAKTGVINDLSQAQDTVIIFNCGSSTSVI